MTIFEQVLGVKLTSTRPNFSIFIIINHGTKIFTDFRVPTMTDQEHDVNNYVGNLYEGREEQARTELSSAQSSPPARIAAGDIDARDQG